MHTATSAGTADCSSAPWLCPRNVLTQVNSELTHKNILNSPQILQNYLINDVSGVFFPTSVIKYEVLISTLKDLENVVSSKLFLKSCLTWHFDSFPIYLKHTGRKCLILGTCQKGIMNQEPFQFTILKLLLILRSLLHYGLLSVL